MNIFLDTSSLFKLYHNEVGSEIIEQVFAHNSVSAIYLSKISKVEFASAAWKKVRTNDISKTDASQLLFLFEADFEKYFFFEIEDAIIEKSAQLISIYGMEGLRTLDSIQ